MRILYGVVGAGMGHATRSRVVIDHLAEAGHRVRVVVSGRACGFLEGLYENSANVEVQRIEGLFMVFEDERVALGSSLRQNLAAAPRSLRRNLAAYRRVVADFGAEVVFSDFESWAYLYGRLHGLPVISIDNMQAIARCSLAPALTAGQALPYRLARAAVEVKLPRAYYYLITSFAKVTPRRARTAVVPPILRPEVQWARREPGSHVLVYQSGVQRAALARTLRRFPCEFRVYGQGGPRREGNIVYREFSERGFVDDLRTARAAVASAGYSLMGECVHLGVPLLAVPIGGQFEQVLNGRCLEQAGYGLCREQVDAAGIRALLAGLPRHEAALRTYRRRDNGLLLACVDELLHSVARGERAPACLRTRARRRLTRPWLAA